MQKLYTENYVGKNIVKAFVTFVIKISFGENLVKAFVTFVIKISFGENLVKAFVTLVIKISFGSTPFEKYCLHERNR